jgi:hypothetical protein
MCQHQPSCPPAGAPDRQAARVVASHPEQGWHTRPAAPSAATTRTSAPARRPRPTPPPGAVTARLIAGCPGWGSPDRFLASVASGVDRAQIWHPLVGTQAAAIRPGQAQGDAGSPCPRPGQPRGQARGAGVRGDIPALPLLVPDDQGAGGHRRPGPRPGPDDCRTGHRRAAPRSEHSCADGEPP